MDELFETVNTIIGSPLWTLAGYVFGFCIVVLWLALVFWTYKDARKRIDDPVIVAVAVLTSLILPFMGTVVYAILRPAEYLAEVRERELEVRAMEQELQVTEGLSLLRRDDPAGLSGLPQLQAAAAVGLSVVRPGAGAGLEDLSLLRSRPESA